MNIRQLRERYAVPEIPKCRVCGGELTVQRAGGGPTIWGCTGMIDDPTGDRNWIYAEGRSCADEHYERSRWSDYRQGGDADVIELIDALEAAERERDELRLEIARIGGAKAIEVLRRDAAAGEPVALRWRFIPMYSDVPLMHWTYIDNPKFFPDIRAMEGAEIQEVFPAAPPAVLPPEIDDIWDAIHMPCMATSNLDERECCVARDAYNQALEDARKLGAQQQKVVELDNVFSVNVAGVAVRVVLLKDVSTSLDAANVKWEVNK